MPTVRVLPLVFLLSLLVTPALALVSEGRPGVPYFNHPLFVETKQMAGDRVAWITLAYGDPRQGPLECRNSIDVFQGKELFRNVPEKSWVLVDYEMQSIVIEGGFAGDADVSKVQPCAGPEVCGTLSRALNSDPQELARRKPVERPTATRKADQGELEAQLEMGRGLVKAGRCRGCHTIEGFGPGHAPNLTWKRYKYEAGWLETFLAHPYRMRPVLDDLMMLNFTSPNAVPSLSRVEIGTIAAYLPQVAWAKTPADRYRGEPWEGYDCFDCHTRRYRERPLAYVPTPIAEPVRDLVKAHGTVQICFSCHPFGDWYPKGPKPRAGSPYVFAPELLLTMEKLEINYLVNFVHDPNYLQPGAAMPRLDFNDQQFEDLRQFVTAIKEMLATGSIVPIHTPYQMEKGPGRAVSAPQ